MENVRDPREHFNEEPRHDFTDVVVGFIGFAGFMTVVFAGMVIAKALIS
ncbi:YqzM family protein [Paenibacillaceae bacterium]|nr:YqzM family protein [Paenibacillaceae bacterium]